MRPRLRPEDTPYWDAYAALGNARPRDMGHGCAIPMTEVLALMELTGIASQTLRAKYLRLIRRLDETFMKYQGEQADRAREAAARTTGQ